MSEIVVSLLAAAIAIILLIGIHELGHFWMARLSGVKVLRFSIGFGKAIWRHTSKKGIEYVLAIVPFGGYVKMLDEREDKVTEEELPHAFNRQPLWKRFIIMIAGPLFNLGFALTAFLLIFMIGVIRPAPIVDVVVPNSPAAKVDIPVGYEIVKIDDRAIEDWFAAAIAIVLRLGDQTKMSVEMQKANDKTTRKTYHIDLKDWKIDPLRPDPLQSLGMLPKLSPIEEIKLIHRKYTFLKAWLPAWQEFAIYTQLNYTIFYKIVIGKISFQSLGGPFTLFMQARLAFERGLVNFIEFLGIVSITVAIINLIPFPGLDGGHLFYLLIERIWGKPVPLNVQVLIFRLGLIILCVFLVQVMINDILRFL